MHIADSVSVSKKRILLVVNGHEFTAVHRLPLLFGAQKKGFVIETVAPSGSPAFQRLHKEGFVVHGVSLTRRGMLAWKEVSAIRELLRLYRRLKPDLVHHATIKPVIYGSIAARLAGIPAVVNAITGLGYVYTSTGYRARLLRLVVDRLYRFAFRHPNHRVIFQNTDDQRTLEGIGAASASKAVLIRGSGVDVANFVPSSEESGKLLVVLPARLLWDKGVGEFVEAVQHLRRRGVVARFALVGGLDEGNPSGIPASRVASWTDEGIVEWWGQVSDMRSVYRAAHLIVLPSYREGLPKVLLEAAACARPVVAANSVGCREVVVDGQTGYLVPPQDSTVLADRIATLLADPARRVAMGHAGRRRVEQEFSTEKVVSETLAVYENLLEPAAYKKEEGF